MLRDVEYYYEFINMFLLMAFCLRIESCDCLRHYVAKRYLFTSIFLFGYYCDWPGVLLTLSALNDSVIAIWFICYEPTRHTGSDLL